MKITLPTLLLSILMCSSSSYAVQVNFSGSTSTFRNGNGTVVPQPQIPNPFGDNLTFNGSFTIDESVVSTQPNIHSVNYYRDGAIDAFQVDIAGNVFTGENGQGIQSLGYRPGDLPQYFEARINSPRFGIIQPTIPGIVNGTLGALILTRMNFTIHAPFLYTPGHVDRVLNNVTVIRDIPTVDTYMLLQLGFLNTLTSENVFYSFSAETTNVGLSLENSPLTPTPIPATIWLFISGILGLSGLANHSSFTRKLSKK